MSYNLVRDNIVKEIKYFSFDIDGVKLPTKKHGRENMINATNMVVIDSKLISNYLKKKLDPKIKKLLLKLIMMFEGADDSGDIDGVLDEANRLKGILENKYKDKLKVEEYKAFLNKLNLIEKQYKKKLVEIELSRFSLTEENLERFKSR